jgi:co-chaperonin GroES (HSP10)
VTTIEQTIALEEQAELERHKAIDAAIAGWMPTGDKIALATIAVTEKRVGSIVTPGQKSPLGEKVERRGRLARVVAVGPEATITIGTKVYCSTFAGAVIEIDGHSILVISEGELLFVEQETP